jgi:hypothetical protein
VQHVIRVAENETDARADLRGEKSLVELETGLRAEEEGLVAFVGGPIGGLLDGMFRGVRAGGGGDDGAGGTKTITKTVTNNNTNTVTITTDAGAECADGVCVLSGTITEDLTLTSDVQWLLRGGVFIGDDLGQTTLTIEPGTTIYGENSTGGMHFSECRLREREAGPGRAAITLQEACCEGDMAHASSFTLPVISLVLITILNDGCMITISHDVVVAERRPQVWSMPEMTFIATILGVEPAPVFARVELGRQIHVVAADPPVKGTTFDDADTTV